MIDRKRVREKAQAAKDDHGGRVRNEKRCEVTRLDIANAKVAIVFPEGKLPAIDPDHPEFVLVLGGVEIHGKVNPKAARKLAVHKGGAVLQGKLFFDAGKLSLADAGFSWIEPKTAESNGGE